MPAGQSTSVERYVNQDGRRFLTLSGTGGSAALRRWDSYGPLGEALFDLALDSSGLVSDVNQPLGDHQNSTRVVLESGPAGAPAAVGQSIDYAPYGQVTAIQESDWLKNVSRVWSPDGVY